MGTYSEGVQIMIIIRFGKKRKKERKKRTEEKEREKSRLELLRSGVGGTRIWEMRRSRSGLDVDVWRRGVYI